jgi:hypothetical protein
VRKPMVEAMRKQFEHLDLTYSIGGQISFDVFPKVTSPTDVLPGRRLICKLGRFCYE